MKKLLLVGVVALCGANINAQETKFGVKAGYSLSTVKNDDPQDDLNGRSMDAKSTFYVGALVEHKFNNKFGIQGEVLYSPLGAKEEVSGNDGGYSFIEKTKLNFGTLLVPVSAKYFITENFAVAGGVSFGIILSAKQKTEVSGNFPPNLGIENGGLDVENDIKNNVKKLNIAPFLGVEYAMESGLFFDARYNLGVSNLVKEGSGSIKNSFFQIGLGFKFGGK